MNVSCYSIFFIIIVVDVVYFTSFILFHISTLMPMARLALPFIQQCPLRALRHTAIVIFVCMCTSVCAKIACVVLGNTIVNSSIYALLCTIFCCCCCFYFTIIWFIDISVRHCSVTVCISIVQYGTVTELYVAVYIYVCVCVWLWFIFALKFMVNLRWAAGCTGFNRYTTPIWKRCDVVLLIWTEYTYSKEKKNNNNKHRDKSRCT